jgi:ribose 5-phosphate isomerase B
MKIAFGADDHNDLTAHVLNALHGEGHEVMFIGDGTDWVDVGRLVGEAVAEGGADRGIVCCWTGTGVSIAANKVDGVRAALCVDAETARGARKWNDANVLALSLRLTTAAVADEIIGAFLSTDADASEAEQIGRLNG